MDPIKNRQPEIITIFRGGADPDDGDENNTSSESGG